MAAKMCLPIISEKKFCQHKDGSKVKVGDAVPHGDGCNTCKCEASGTLSCSILPCINRPDGKISTLWTATPRSFLNNKNYL